MFLVSGTDFQPVRRRHPAHKQPLIVHSRPGRPENHLIIFIHGLGGRRYATWGHFPRYLFEAIPTIAIGMYDYRSGHRALWPSSAMALDDLAIDIATRIRQAEYTKVVLIGHSMGGLIAKAVIKYLVDDDVTASHGSRVIEKIAGLILLATPHLGSLRIPFFYRFLSKHGRALRPHSPFVRSLYETFTNKLDIGEHHCSKKPHIPLYLGVPLNDTYVDRMSASLGVPKNQILPLRGTHTGFVKPISPEDVMVMWVVEIIQRRLGIPSKGSMASSIAGGPMPACAGRAPLRITTGETSRFAHENGYRTRSSLMPLFSDHNDEGDSSE